MDTVRMGVIGIGNIGKLHLQNITESSKVSLAAVCDIVPERAQAAAEQYDGPPGIYGVRRRGWADRDWHFIIPRGTRSRRCGSHGSPAWRDWAGGA